MTDALQHLAHDHGDLNRRVLALQGAIRSGAPRAQLVTELHELRDLLFLHFAREEEGLFPFVAEVAAELKHDVDAMETAHDTICGAVARMVHLANSDGPLDGLHLLFERFEAAYAKHAETEGKVLSQLERRLDAASRAKLAALVDGL